MADGIYRSKTLELRTPTIQRLTRTNFDGHRYYRPTHFDGWRKLRTTADFERLNAAISRGISFLN